MACLPYPLQPHAHSTSRLPNRLLLGAPLSPCQAARTSQEDLSLAPRPGAGASRGSRNCGEVGGLLGTEEPRLFSCTVEPQEQFWEKGNWGLACLSLRLQCCCAMGLCSQFVGIHKWAVLLFPTSPRCLRAPGSGLFCPLGLAPAPGSPLIPELQCTDPSRGSGPRTYPCIPAPMAITPRFLHPVPRDPPPP